MNHAPSGGLTVVVVLDAKTAEQAAISTATWARHRPEMRDLPWLVFYDPVQISAWEARDAIRPAEARDVRLAPWQRGGLGTAYGDQREKMLTCWVYAAMVVETRWWMKIDADALALRPSDWLDQTWFQPTDRGPPAWIASPWGYTKPADQMERLDEWGDTVPGLSRHPRLAIAYDPGARKACHPRMASWLSYYHTPWTRWAAELAMEHAPRLTTAHPRIPVPSQDGYHFYLAARTKAPYRTANMKRRGWTNCPRIDQLRQRAAEALR